MKDREKKCITLCQPNRMKLKFLESCWLSGLMTKPEKHKQDAHDPKLCGKCLPTLHMVNISTEHATRTAMT